MSTAFLDEPAPSETDDADTDFPSSGWLVQAGCRRIVVFHVVVVVVGCGVDFHRHFPLGVTVWRRREDEIRSEGGLPSHPTRSRKCSQLVLVRRESTFLVLDVSLVLVRLVVNLHWQSARQLVPRMHGRGGPAHPGARCGPNRASSGGRHLNGDGPGHREFEGAGSTGVQSGDDGSGRRVLLGNLLQRGEVQRV